MQQATIGAKYQIVIPKEVREKIKGIKPGVKVMVKQEDENTMTVRTSKRSWSDDNYGAFKKYWKGIDPAKEIDKMRAEWEERSKELEKIAQGK